MIGENPNQLTLSHNHYLSKLGFPLYDFYLGRELNPRVYGVELKMFCELRPGIMLWLLLDLCYVMRAREEGNLTPALLLVTVCHFVYVADVMYFEVRGAFKKSRIKVN